MMTDDELAAERAALWDKLDALVTTQAAQVRAALEARRALRALRSFGPYRPDGWSHYDREVNRHQNDFGRENYGL